MPRYLEFHRKYDILSLSLFNNSPVPVALSRTFVPGRRSTGAMIRRPSMALIIISCCVRSLRSSGPLSGTCGCLKRTLPLDLLRIVGQEIVRAVGSSIHRTKLRLWGCFNAANEVLSRAPGAVGWSLSQSAASFIYGHYRTARNTLLMAAR